MDNIEQTVSTVQAAGGNILQDPLDIPNVGRIAVVEDPAGAVLGFLQPAMPQPAA